MNRLLIRVLHHRNHALARARHLLRDERGDSLQWVMGLAIAAVVIIALLAFGKQGLLKLQGFWTSAS